MMSESSARACPYCRHDQATRVTFTPWGGVVGPLVMSLVKCEACAKNYNGRSGRKVEKAIRVYTWTAMAVLAFVAAWAIYVYAGGHGASEKGNQRGTASLAS
jgi:hypothetical protein